MNIQHTFAIQLVSMLNTDNLLVIFLRLLITSKRRSFHTVFENVSKISFFTSVYHFEDKCAQ